MDRAGTLPALQRLKRLELGGFGLVVCTLAENYSRFAAIRMLIGPWPAKFLIVASNAFFLFRFFSLPRSRTDALAEEQI